VLELCTAALWVPRTMLQSTLFVGRYSGTQAPRTTMTTGPLPHAFESACSSVHAPGPIGRGWPQFDVDALPSRLHARQHRHTRRSARHTLSGQSPSATQATQRSFS